MALPKKKGLFRRFRRWFFTAPVFESLLVGLIAAAVWLLSILPKRWTWFIGRWLGRLIAVLDRRHRKTALDNLRIAFPEKTEVERDALFIKSYEHLGLVVADFCRQRHVTAENLHETITASPGVLEATREEFARGKGLIAAAGHIGNWEISGHAYALWGFPTISIARRLDSPKMDAYVLRLRGLSGNEIHHKEGAVRAAIRAMKENKALGLIMDQHARQNAVPIPFFGRNVMTVDTAAHLVLKYDCGLICYAAVRQPNGSYLFIAGDPLRKHFQPSGDKEKDVRAILRFCNEQFENFIRAYPEQWLWMHRRWRDE
jgi:KDO2-lipid IV(A) lauroyltransferase